MSLILDALKKSDMERSRQKAPDIAASGAPAAPPAAPKWLWPVVGLLVLNGTVLGYLLLKPAPVVDNGEPVQSVAAQPAGPEPTVSTTPATSIASTPTQKADVRSLLDETIRNAAASRESVEASPPVTDTQPAATPAGATRPADDESASLPTFSQLRANGQLDLAPLSLELHVYSDDAAARFAFINGQKVREGDSLNAGGRVSEITRVGVVLEHAGQRFTLPRD